MRAKTYVKDIRWLDVTLRWSYITLQSFKGRETKSIVRKISGGRGERINVLYLITSVS